ncbi:transketolase [Ramlibacter humi]|uniref:Transketolase n=2 Tax=Ramlibacter humi TaxID=2530451 RepID=A0A4Z0BS50_9BURK|nr:transketolase [Ramlibacter humi]
MTKASVTPATVLAARKRLLQMHHESGVGHIGGNLSSLDSLLVLFHERIRHADRFVLSKGHSAGALYTALWSIGRLTDADLRTFHQDGTLLSGHPPAKGLGDVLFATGSLGHGLSLAAGTALALRMKESTGHVYCVTSDGEWQEGSTWEALVFACHHRLANLTVLVDHNGLQGFGSTGEVASMSPLWEKVRGFDAQATVIDGHDLDAIRGAMDSAATGPRLVFMRTVKGAGVSFLEGRMDSHYLPLTADKYQSAVQELDAA